jgi:hypothetical protein
MMQFFRRSLQSAWNAAPSSLQHFRANSRTWSTLAAGVAIAGCASVSFADDGEMVVFSGNANPGLAEEIAFLLDRSLGKVTVGRFADGEVNVQVNENVRGKDVFIVQPTCSPVNEHLMELLLMISTMRRASAERITGTL